MRHEKRIAEAFAENGIVRILIIDDGYDAPALGGSVPGELTDFLDSAEGAAACEEAGLTLAETNAAKMAAFNDDAEANELVKANTFLFARFVATREARFDPGGRFQTLKGATLDVLAPLATLLSKCGNAVDVRYAGLADGEEIYLDQKPQVVFLDFYLSPDVPVGSSAEKLAARKQSIELLNRLLNATQSDIPAIVLMSSEGVKKKAEQFRQEVEARGRNPLALRFRFLQKGWVKSERGEIKIANEAADALLDTSQGFVFGQVLQRALSKWREGADNAMNALLKEIGGLEPKDFAYLFRFRLVSEGQPMSDYLEWMFGESLRALVCAHVPWDDEAFEQLDNAELSKGIEGAFEGPSARIARIFHRIRIDEHKTGRRRYQALGDIYISARGKSVRTIITPDCDLVVRKEKTKVGNVLTMGGELRSFDQDSASADQFIFRNKKPYSLKWNPKDLQTFPVSGEGSLANTEEYHFAGTLRPLYAQEMQRHALTDLSRVGLAVAPAMGVDAKVTAWLRVKRGKGLAFDKLRINSADTATILLERADASSGHKVLLRRQYVHVLLDELRLIELAALADDDAERLSEFLKEKNQDQLISSFLAKGSHTKKGGPLGTTLSISGKPDGKQGSPWLQLLLELSDEGIEELLTVDPLLQLPTNHAVEPRPQGEDPELEN